MVIAIYALILAIIFWIDLRYRLILDKIVYPAMVLALALSLLPGGIGWQSSLIGGMAGFLPMLLVFILSRDGMGFGDVKLAALIGLMVGFPLIIIALPLSFIVGSIVSIILLINKKELSYKVPFGTLLTVSTLFTLFLKVPLWISL